MKKSIILIGLFFGLFLLSNCTNSSSKENSSTSSSSKQEESKIKNADVFIGKWNIPEDTRYFPIDITRNGDAYILSCRNDKIAFTLSNGVLIGDQDIGNITYGSENDKIYYGNKEWSRVK